MIILLKNTDLLKIIFNFLNSHSHADGSLPEHFRGGGGGGGALELINPEYFYILLQSKSETHQYTNYK